MKISNSFYEQENVLLNEAPKLSQAALQDQGNYQNKLKADHKHT